MARNKKREQIPDFVNKLYYGDCLDWMEKWPKESVDLVYLDPPFNSKSDYNILFGKVQDKNRQAQQEAFVDTWAWDTAAAKRFERMSKARDWSYFKAVTGLYTIIGETGMMAYLTYMAERLELCRQMLKPTGSIFLHCDDTSAHYLKILMDGIFGVENYRNHITWRRATSHSDAKRFGRIADTVLFYSKSNDPYWAGHEIAAPKTSGEMLTAYPTEDRQYPERGWYRSADLTGAGAGRIDSLSSKPWNGYEVHSRNRHWAVPLTGKYAEYIEKHFIPGYRSIEGIHDRLDALDEAGLIHHPVKNGFWPGLKRYAKADQGNVPQNIILEPIGFTNYSKRDEYLGYPTQKPVGLLEKLLIAGCPKGGHVLDPFCGCGTTIEAAIQTGRNWIGIDISTFAIEMICDERFPTRVIEIDGIPQEMAGATRLSKENPFTFETWAIRLIRGIVPNTKQRSDGGRDGSGMLTEEINGSNLILAQVKGGRFKLSDLRDFGGVMAGDKAAMGVFITLNCVTSKKAKEFCLSFGHIKSGLEEYPRLACWSIEEYFESGKKPPRLPNMYDPRTGEKSKQIAMPLRHDED